MKKGIISNLYPTTKGLFIFISLIISFFYDWKIAYFGIIPFCIVCSILEGKVISYLKKLVVVLGVYVLFVFVLKMIMDTGESAVWIDLGFIKITEDVVIGSLNQSKLVGILVATIFLYFETTDIEDLMLALQRYRVSHVTTYIVLSTLQLIPEMAKKSKVIMQAQQARGIETEGSVITRMRAFFPALGPLIISSITEIEDRSVTLEVRGFSSENKKTSLKELQKTRMDTAVVILMFVAGAVLVVGRFV